MASAYLVGGSYTMDILMPCMCDIMVGWVLWRVDFVLGVGITHMQGISMICTHGMVAHYHLKYKGWWGSTRKGSQQYDSWSQNHMVGEDT